MGIFDRIRKIFSRSESSNTDSASNRVFQRSHEVEHDKHFNIPTSNPTSNPTRSSNVTGRSSATALHRSNTISVTAQASGASYREPDLEPDANFKRTNSCKGLLTSPLSRDAVHSAECENASNTATDVSELPRLKSSYEVKDDSKICNVNNVGRKYPRPSDSESLSAEYNTTGVGESRRKISSDHNILQTKPKPTSNQHILSSVGNIDTVNCTLLESTDRKNKVAIQSENREKKSSVQEGIYNTSKEPKTITSEAKSGHNMSYHYHTPAISPQEKLNKNYIMQTLSNTIPKPCAINSSVTPYQIERKLSDINQGVRGSGNTQQTTYTTFAYHTPAISRQDNYIMQTLSNTKTTYTTHTTFPKNEISSYSKTSTTDFSFNLHKTGSKVSDHSQRVGGNTQQLTTTFRKSKTSSIPHTPAFPSSNKLQELEIPKVSDHSGRIRETFSKSLQSATLEKTTTGLTTRTFKAPACAVVPPMTSFKRDSTTIPSRRSERMDDSVATNYKPRSFLQSTRTIDVDKVVKAPEASILKTQRTSTVFHPVKESSTGSSSFSRPVHALYANFSPLPAEFQRCVVTTRETQLKDYKITKPQFSLRNFTFNLKTPAKDRSFEPENVIYHNQWTECSAQINVDNEIDHPVHFKKTGDVSIECPHVDFRDTKIKNGYLHFTMKCSATGNISVLIKIGTFAFTKDFKVIFNPCSSYCSDMTIEKINPEEDEFVFRMFIFDVFGEPVPSNSTASCHLDASFQSTENKVVRTVEHIVQGQICYDITVRGKRPWSQDLVVLLNGEPISHPREFEFTEEEDKAIDVLEDEDYEWIREYFEEDDLGITIPLATGDDGGKFVTYKNNCELQSQNAITQNLVCKNERKYDILGEDCAHINNIGRVLDLKDRLEVQETDGCAIIVLRNVQTHLHPKCKEVVQHLLRGLYYRRKASEAARVRMEWKDRLLSIEEVLWLDRETPSFVFCKYFRDFFGDLMNKYNRETCNELFKFFNFQRDESEVDLHGLLVADEKMLKSLRLNLLIGSLNKKQIKKILEICRIFSEQGRERQTLRKKFRKGEVPENLVKNFIDNEDNNEDYDNDDYDDDDYDDDYDDDDGRGACGRSRQRSRLLLLRNELKPWRSTDQTYHVHAIIRRCRLESDEAIRKLEEKLDKFNLEKAITNKTPWLEIIVGAGRHSKQNKQNIRPKVEKLLKKRNLKFAPVNKGSLVVTFKPYNGPEPCFGEYFCEKCDRCWKSSKSYVRKYQKCSSCKANCWPVKQREKEKVTNYRRDGSEKRQSRPHQSSLCQRCQELGRPCNEDDYYDSDADY